MEVLQAYAPICGLHDAIPPVFPLIHEHLTERSGKGRIPGRQHLDPTELKRYLPMINLIDLVGQADDYRLRYRLVGGMQNYYFADDKNCTGRYLDEFWSNEPVARARILGDFEKALHQRGPFYGEFVDMSGRFNFLSYKRAIFPLARDGQNIDSFACIYSYGGRFSDAVNVSQDPLFRVNEKGRSRSPARSDPCFP